MSSPPDKFNCLDYLSDQGLPDSPEFAGIHGWVDEVRNSRQELQFMKLFWNSRGKKHLNTERYCYIKATPAGNGKIKIEGKDHQSRDFTMEHLENADFDTEETRARQHHTPPRKSISHPGGPGEPGPEDPGPGGGAGSRAGSSRDGRSQGGDPSLDDQPVVCGTSTRPPRGSAPRHLRGAAFDGRAGPPPPRRPRRRWRRWTDRAGGRRRWTDRAVRRMRRWTHRAARCLR